MNEMNRKTIELLSPAGDMERLRMAVAYGADAVYLAGGQFGMRAFAGNFTREELAQAVTLCHEKGVAVHVTCNTMPRNEEAVKIPEFLEYLESLGVDAVIVADLGVFEAAKKYAPHVKRHMSTQAGITNYAAARAWHDMGAHRVILCSSGCRRIAHRWANFTVVRCGRDAVTHLPPAILGYRHMGHILQIGERHMPPIESHFPESYTDALAEYESRNAGIR